jgi:alpha-tubulin suppressor-like RCC1 family protein
MRLIDDNGLERFGQQITQTYANEQQTTEALNAVENDINNHVHDDGVSINEVGDLNALDTNEKSNLVGAINEVYTSVLQNNKQLIVDAFGEPLTSDDSFYDMSNGITNLLNEFKGSLTKKGVEVNSNDKYKELVNKISTLSYNEPYIIKKVICGNAHLFILKQDGNVMSCGYNLRGQLGLGDIKNRVAFTKVEIDNVKDIYCGQHTTYLVKEDGSLWACGSNKNGQLGIGSYDENSHPTFVQVPFTGGDIAHIACGENYAIIVCEDGSIWGCGDNSFAQLGIDLGDGSITLENVTTFTKGSIDNVKKVACGVQHTIVLKNDGTVWGVGYNLEGELGLGNTETKYSFVNTGLSNIKDIACGYWYSFAVTNNNEVYATGYNNKGQLGLGDTTDRHSFTKVNINEVYQVACGYNSTYILKTNGSVWVTGYNDKGQLGLGDTTDRHSFTKATVADSYDILQVAVGVYHGYILSADGTLWVTGSNEFGQLALGFGATNFKKEFTKVDLYNTGDTSQINKYNYNVNVFFQTHEPIAAQYGDIWIPLSSSDYNLHFAKNASEITSKTDKDIYVRLANTYIKVNLDDSLNNFLNGIQNEFNINLTTNTFQYEFEQCNIPLFANAFSTVFAKIGLTKLYNSTTKTWDRIYSKFWNGSKWMGFTTEDDIDIYFTQRYDANSMHIGNFNLQKNSLTWHESIISILSKGDLYGTQSVMYGDVIATFVSANTNSNSCWLFTINRKTGDVLGIAELGKNKRESYIDFLNDGTIIVYFCNLTTYEYNLYKYDMQCNLLKTYNNKNNNSDFNAQMTRMWITDNCILLSDSSGTKLIAHDFDLTKHKESNLYAAVLAEGTTSSSAGHPTLANTTLPLTPTGKAWVLLKGTYGVNGESGFKRIVYDVDEDLNVTYTVGSTFLLPRDFRINYIGQATFTNFIHKETGEEMFVCWYINNYSYRSEVAIYNSEGTCVYQDMSLSERLVPLVVYEGGQLLLDHTLYGATTLYRFDLQTYELINLERKIPNSTSTAYGSARNMLTSSGKIGRNNENYGI